MSALARRRPRLRPRLRLRTPRVRLSPALAAVLIGTVIVLAAGWFWFRDSSLVAIRNVAITGVSGPHAAQIRGALRASALTMTTLDVDAGRLRSSVEPYHDVVSIGVDTSFPHEIAIHVVEQVPLATVAVGGRTLAVAAGGVLLRARPSDGRLPQLAVTVDPGVARVTEGSARAALAALAAAPWPMIGRIVRAADTSGRGVVITLRNGPQLVFGDPSQLRAKWAAAIAVLADSGAAGASYIDLTDPAHPAAGATPAAATTTPATTPTTATTTATAATGG